MAPTLFDKQPRRSGTNSAFPTGVIAKIAPNQTLCQAAIVPQDTRAIEIPFQNGARATGVSLELKGGATERVVARAPAAGSARGPRASRCRARCSTTCSARYACTRRRGHTALVLGASDKRGLELDGKIAPGAISMAYYRPGSERLISMLPVIAQRIGRTRGHLGGAWRGVAVLVLFGVGVGCPRGCWSASRAGARRRVALVVAVVAGVNALAWGFLTPTFQTPDEPYHVSYVQDLAEHGKPPRAAKNTAVGGAARCSTAPPRSATSTSTRSAAATGARTPTGASPRRWRRSRARTTAAASANVRDYPPALLRGARARLRRRRTPRAARRSTR